jgi:membrane-anchored protein YejM (alkaline phosphatase superfamily)
MQTSVPEVMDISKEPQKVLEATAPSRASPALPTTACSAAVWSKRACASCSSSTGAGTSTAPADKDIRDGLTKKMAATDKPVAALIRDLKQRGLLDDTLVVWGGEFGRTPFREGRTAASEVLGRDHYPDCYTLFSPAAA